MDTPSRPSDAPPRPLPRARLRFPKAARLFRSADFRRVREQGREQRGRLLILTALAGAEAGPSRFGLVTSRRVGIAVIRNLVRRRLRECVRVARPAVPDGWWIVISARPAAARATFAALRAEWVQLGRRAGCLAKLEEPA